MNRFCHHEKWPVLLPTVFTIVFAAQLLAQTRGRLQDLDPRARTKWRVSVPVEGETAPHRYAVLPERVAVLSADGNTVRLYDSSGQAIGEINTEIGLSGIAASPRGDHFLGTSILSEDEFFHVVFDRDGNRRWTVSLGSTLSFTPSGSFLITDLDAIDASQPPRVLRVEDGQAIWSDPENPDYWQVAAAANDTLAYYRRGRLALIDLRTGTTRWERSVPADPESDLGRVQISLNGGTIAVQSRTGLESQPQLVTRIYDVEGGLYWERRDDLVPGESNGGRLSGVSANGALLAIDDLHHFSLVRTADGAELVRLNEGTVCCIAAFTERTVAFQRGPKTRILRLSPGGTLESDTQLDEALQFLYRAPPRGGVGRYEPTVMERRGNSLELSAIETDLGRPEDR